MEMPDAPDGIAVLRAATLADAVAAAGLAPDDAAPPRESAGRASHPGSRPAPGDTDDPAEWPRLRAVEPADIPDTVPDDILDDPF